MLRFILAVILAGGLATAMRATTIIAPDLRGLVAQADYVVSGEVKGVRCERRGSGSDRPIVTVISLQVTETVVGRAPTEVELVQLGGELGGRHLRVVGLPVFQRGDRTILFVQNNGRQFCPFVAAAHGCYFIAADPAQPDRQLVHRANGTPLMAAAQVRDELKTGAETRTASAVSSGGMTAKNFIAAIKSEARAAGRGDVAP